MSIGNSALIKETQDRMNKELTKTVYNILFYILVKMVSSFV